MEAGRGRVFVDTKRFDQFSVISDFILSQYIANGIRQYFINTYTSSYYYYTKMMSLREVDILHEENGLREAFLDETNAHQRQGYYCSSADQPPYDNQDASSTSEDESYELLSARETTVLKNDPYKRKSHPFRGISDSIQPGSGSYCIHNR